MIPGVVKLQDRARLRRWNIVGVFIIFALASLWHFVYDWLPCGCLATISPVNESPWEHAKLFFVPPLIWYIVMYFAVGRFFPNYIFAYAVSLVIMPVLMLLLYMIYSSFTDKTIVFDIINSVLTITIGTLLAYRMTISGFRFHGPVYTIFTFAIVLSLFLLYAAMTIDPPHHPLFLDKETMQYGVPR